MRKAHTSRARKLFAPLIAVLMLALSVVIVNSTTAVAEEIYICHATGDTKFPKVAVLEDVKGFVVNSPSETGDVSGHVGTDHQDGWDIIPPVEGLPNGQNWTEYGQEVYSLGCNLPATDASASVQVGAPTCTSTSPVTFVKANATSVPATPNQSVGTHSVTFTADYGHRFSDGSKTLTLSYTVLPALPVSEACPARITIPAAPSVTDPCGSGNATWNVPGNGNGLAWTLNQAGELVVTITAAHTVFTDSNAGPTSHNFGLPTETNTAPCTTGIAIPAAPSVTDPCGSGNASWNVPGDGNGLAWTLNQAGELVVTITAANTVFNNSNAGPTSHNFGLPTETNTDPCIAEIAVPAAPSVSDPCDPNNAEWIVPGDDATFQWDLVDGELIVTILTDNTVFEGTEDTTFNFGEVVETVTEPCEVGGQELEIPAEPGIKDPCGTGNASWIVPDDNDSLDWTLTDGVLSVEITVPDTVFSGTQDTVFSFGEAEETNTKACDVKGEEGNPNNPPDVEVKGEQGVVPTAGVPNSVDAGLGAASGSMPAGRNPLWLLAVGGGLALMGSAGLRRRVAANR